MAKRIQLKRLAWLALLLSLAFAGLGYRLVDLQLLRHEELSVVSQSNTERKVFFEPRRGDILDVKGNLLATSTPVKTICADPSFIGNRSADLARFLAPFLQESEPKLTERLQPRVSLEPDGRLKTNLNVVLKRKVPAETWEKIQSGLTNLSFGVDESKLPLTNKLFYQRLRQKAIFAQADQLRTYPAQTLAAHVLGFVVDKEGELEDRPVQEMMGKEGIERFFDSKLAGVRGWRITERDRKGRELVTRREQEVKARDGLNVVLTLDSVIQHIVESALAEAMEKHSPISISGIVVRPRTGEVLAMATLPTYDPNRRPATPDAMRNRVIMDGAEPGSTFKVVVVSGALNDGVVSLSETFDCEHGHFFYGGRTLHDHESYGVLSVENIITKSSNIGAAKIGIKLGENRVYEYIRAFGFGEPTGIFLPGEVGCSVYVKPVDKWRKVTLAQIPMGHGICVTRMQMVMAMCAIANNGVLMKPMLVDRLEDRDHSLVVKYTPQRVRQVISEPTAKLMVRALKTVVTPEGTGAKAALEHYTAGGKTGTAQKVENGRYVEKFFSSFIGFFPADNPELCISVTMDEPKGVHYGGQVAAPVFKEIAERTANYLSIPPDRGDISPAPERVASRTEPASLKTAAAPARPDNNP